MRLREELKKITRQSIARFDRVDNAQISRTDTQTHTHTDTQSDFLGFLSKPKMHCLHELAIKSEIEMNSLLASFGV